MYTQLMIMADHDDKYPYTNRPSSSFGLPNDTGFEVSDFFEFSGWIDEDPAFSSPSVAGYNPQSPTVSPSMSPPDEIVVNSTGVGVNSNSFYDGSINRDSGSRKEKKEMRKKVAFKTKSEVEVLDDGFKWRKYGKKMVKNSPNPRNYYRCSVEGCPVKKRVERDKEDPKYVVTTYEGIHNHQGPHR